MFTYGRNKNKIQNFGNVQNSEFSFFILAVRQKSYSKLFVVLLRSDKIDVVAPLVDHRGHILRNLGIKLDPFSRARMYETESLGVKGLTGTKLKTVLDELTVLCVDRPLADL